MDKLMSVFGQFTLKHLNFLIGVFINILLIYGFCKLVDFFANRLNKSLRQKNQNTALLNLLPILVRIIKVVIIFLLLAGFLQSFGYNVTSLIAGFGITGLAVGFAAKETLGNVFGSIGLLADKVYKIGEYVKFDGAEGTVEDINLRSTSIRTMDGCLVNIPNNVIANEPITNYSLMKERKVDISIDVEYSTSDEKLNRALLVLEEIASNNLDIIEGAYAVIDSMAPSSIVLRLHSYTKKTAYKEFLQVRSDIMKEIIIRYRQEGIDFAFPSTSVYMAKG